MSETYDPKTIEEKWQRVWDDARAWHVDNPADPATPTARRATCSRCCRTRPARCTSATCSSTRSATSSCASGAATACSVLHPMGWDAFGLPAENSAIKEGKHPRETTERNIVNIRRTMRRMGWCDGLGPRDLDPRSALLPLAAVAVPPLPRAGARVPQGRAGQVVPERPDRARERAGARRRHLRALRRAGRVARDGAVVLPDHRLRRRAARRPRHGRLARVDQGAPAELDRPLRGRRDRLPDRGVGRGRHRLHDPAGHALRRDVLRARARARARSRGSSRTRCRRTCATPRRRRPRSARRRSRRPASSRACTRSTRSTASGSRSTSPTTSSPTTAPARSWPFPPTTSATTTSRRRSTCRCAR